MRARRSGRAGREAREVWRAARLGIDNGKRGVAGIVAWPARHCADVSRVPLFRYEDADGGYRMDPDTAGLFAAVRDAARSRPGRTR